MRYLKSNEQKSTYLLVVGILMGQDGLHDMYYYFDNVFLQTVCA
jgi:hypothetical protein